MKHVKEGWATAVLAATIVICCALRFPGRRPQELVAVVPRSDAGSDPGSPFVIAMTTVHRYGRGKISYLRNSLHSLYCALNASSPELWPPVLVFNGEVPATQHQAFDTVNTSEEFTHARQHGLTFLTRKGMHPELHSPAFVAMLAARTQLPELNKLHKQMKEGAEADPADRLWWRSKEVLDAAYALETALERASSATHVIFLQDDVQLSAGFLQIVQRDLLDATRANETMDIVTLFERGSGTRPRQADPWQVQFGLVGLVFRADILSGLISHLRAKFAEAPVDWLMNRYIISAGLKFWVWYPNLVQHVGRQSSLAGKVQPVVSGTFKENGC